MSRVEIKICGVTKPEHVHAAAKGGADYVGFVHYERSPRHLSVSDILQLREQMPPHMKAVVLLVNPVHDLLREFWVSGRPNIIQLHGDEPANEVGVMKSDFPFEYWKAIQVSHSRDLFRSRSYVGAADRVLFDAAPPKGIELPGGNGVRIDWNLLKGYRNESLPWGLAGGLNPDNVAEAIRLTQAPLVDVSSGVESAPGVKDVDKITAFCKAVS